MAGRSSPVALHFIAPGFQDMEEEEAGLLNRSIVPITPAITEQLRNINMSSAIQVGHRLAAIGDELNQFYNWRFQNRLARFARASFYGMVIVCQSRVMGILKSVMKWFTRLGKNNLAQRMVAYGGDWGSALALKNVYHKFTPTVLFAVLSGIVIIFELYK